MDVGETGVHELSDKEIIGMVQASSDHDSKKEEEEDQTIATISHTEAAEASALA